MVGNDGSVTIETAAELTNLDVRTIRQWNTIGSLPIVQRGDTEMVHLGQVRALARGGFAPTGGSSSRTGTLRSLLREATPVSVRSVASLQELARERATPIR